MIADRYSVVADGLGFPEGPVVDNIEGVPSVVLVDITGGRLLAVEQANGSVTVLATGAHGPNGAVCSGDGCIVVADNGGIGPTTDVPSHGGRVVRWRRGSDQFEVRATGFVTPNDLVYGPDGALYMTDPGGHPARRIHSTLSRLTSTHDALVAEVVVTAAWFMNGLAFDHKGMLVIVDTLNNMLWRMHPHDPRSLAAVADLGHVRPDGMAVAADGRMFVAGTHGSHSVAVLSPEGSILAELPTGSESKPSNCCLTPGMLWVTDSALGRLLAFAVDAEPLPLYAGPS